MPADTNPEIVGAEAVRSGRGVSEMVHEFAAVLFPDGAVNVMLAVFVRVVRELYDFVAGLEDADNPSVPLHEYWYGVTPDGRVEGEGVAVQVTVPPGRIVAGKPAQETAGGSTAVEAVAVTEEGTEPGTPVQVMLHG